MLKITGLLFSLFLILLSHSCTTAKNPRAVAETKDLTEAGKKKDTFLTNILESYPHYFDTLLQNKDQWKIKIIYTQIDRNDRNEPILTHHYFNSNSAAYFYPASTVKLPVAALSLQKLQLLNIPGLDKYTTMVTGAASPGQTAVYNDPTTADGRPSVAHYIKKIFLVSDNDAYNRLYEFLGQEYLNNTLHQMGYYSVQLLHRLQLPLTEEQNRLTNPVAFYDSVGKLLYRQPMVHSKLRYQQRQTLLGNGFISGGKLVEQPFDFSTKNRFTLQDLHTVLQSIVLPQTVPEKQRVQLTDDDYAFLYKCMSMLPQESRYPSYDSTYPDGYVKFFLFGGDGKIENGSLRIFNKVGDAYGFLHDVAYIVDLDEGIEFLLSASIYCNSDNIFNDDKYDYATIGFPFLKHLGEVIYQHEAKRKKDHLPDLSKFRIDYAN